MSDSLDLAGRTFLVTGLRNKKSVAAHVGRQLEAAGATPVWVVHSEERRVEVRDLVGERAVHVCDVRDGQAIAELARALARDGPLDGLVHSIAFADYAGGFRPFHETERAAFLEAIDVSCYSLIALANALRGSFTSDASVVTISISSTAMAAENYGFMAPAKAALDSAVVFLAKSFSAFSRVRFNAVRAGLLKTSASAGIPGYADSYLFAERATLRKEGVRTDEVASTALFLLSPRSSGINAQGLVVDAGMGVNYFDRSLVRPPEEPR